MSKRIWTVRASLAALIGVLAIAWSPAADAQSTRCEIPRAARDIWRCENGFVIGPENVIIRLPIPETDPEALYNAGIEAAGREDWRVAIAYFTAAHQRAHLVPRYMYNLGLAHARAGNEVPAIAWLAAYLLAEPNAPNRPAVWAQVADLEAAVATKVDLLYERAESAASLVPNVATSQYDEAGARSGSLARLASLAAGANDWPRAQRFFEASNAARRSGAGDQSLQGLRSATMSSALLDGDLALAESISRELPSSLDPGLEQMFATLRSGGSNVNLCRSYMLEAYPMRYVCKRTWVWSDPSHAAVDALRTGNRVQVLSQLQERDNWQRLPVALVLARRNQDAHNLLVQGGGGWAEMNASLVVDVLLRTGAASSADRFAQLADQTVLRERHADGETRVDIDSGWFAARARALIIAEGGEVRGAADLLQSYLSRRLADGSFSHRYIYTPSSLWPVVRHDGTLLLVEYLIDRNRIREALELSSELDTLRQSILLDQMMSNIAQGRLRVEGDFVTNRAAVVMQAASGSVSVSPARRRALENSVIAAATLSGACFDVEWWLTQSSLGRNRNVRQASFGPHILVTGLGEAASDMARGVRRARAAYTLAGGTWGQ